ncbi:unnamed protein product [Blepharisma stoltei]|uniref:Uncharacterized protein n=1 Tax=Blepharisma stoltei TaxID=1481888 RepID=A0AAU9J5G9_9CILI|nr:unnamed protein product [Blepharisma stoltei]
MENSQNINHSPPRFDIDGYPVRTKLMTFNENCKDPWKRSTSEDKLTKLPFDNQSSENKSNCFNSESKEKTSETNEIIKDKSHSIETKNNEKTIKRRTNSISDARNNLRNCIDSITSKPKCEESPTKQSNDNKVMTQRKLFEKRKSESRAIYANYVESYLNSYQSRIEFNANDRHKSSNNPFFRTQREKKEAVRNLHRNRSNLAPNSDIIKTSSEISLAYNEKPVVSTQKELLAKRQSDKLKELEIYKNYKYVDPEEKIAQRELQNVQVSKEDSKTHEKVKVERQIEDIEYNMKTFGNSKLGIHGKELPQFLKNKKEYWTERDGYKNCPESSSRLLMLLKRSSIDVRDTLKANDTITENNNNERKIILQRSSSVPKVTTHIKSIKLFDRGASENTRHHVNYRMSTIKGYFDKSIKEAEMQKKIILSGRKEKISHAGKVKSRKPEVGLNTQIIYQNNDSGSEMASNHRLLLRSNSVIRTVGFIEKSQ